MHIISFKECYVQCHTKACVESPSLRSNSTIYSCKENCSYKHHPEIAIKQQI